MMNWSDLHAYKNNKVENYGMVPGVNSENKVTWKWETVVDVRERIGSNLSWCFSRIIAVEQPVIFLNAIKEKLID